MLRASFVRRAVVSLTTTAVASGTGNIAHIVLNNPSTRNAMTVQMGEEFRRAVEEVKLDKSVRAVVVSGAGGVFSAGGDTQFLADRIKDTPTNNVAVMRQFYSRFLCLRTLPVPVVASITGHAIGAGFCVALACDVRVASKDAKLAVNFVRLGIHPGMGATFTLPRLIGLSGASRLLLTGDTISSDEAMRLGLVSHVAESPEATDAAALKQASLIATSSSIAVRETLSTLRGNPADLDAALQREAEAQAACYAQGKDLGEALAALRERRTPKFE